MLVVKQGKEHICVNGITLGDATKKELKTLYDMGHPYVIKQAAKEPKAAKEVKTK